MPAFVSRAQQNQLEELSEVPYSGPWGGVQSELPLDRIEPYGLYDIVNMICRKGALSTRPGFTTLSTFPHNGPTLGIFDFFDSSGTRHQMAISDTRLFEWVGGTQTWLEIPGVLFTGGPTQLWSATTNNYLMLFSQGVDKIQAYDGIAIAVAPVSPNAPAAKFLEEYNLSLIAANTVEGGVSFPQRVRWAGPGDPTDWVSLNAGLEDLKNNFGPITGIKKIFQTAFIFQFRGITQMIATGNGLAPFQFIPIGSNNRGCIMPYSLAANGGEFACYVGNDNIYQFDGSNANPIGDMPLGQNRTRLGARSRIFADLSVADPLTVNGYISTSFAGVPFNAYWLNIPGISSWIYNFDEQNWFRATWAKKLLSMGTFDRKALIRIKDLVGPISAQNWTPATLNSSGILDQVMLGFPDSQGGMDFTSRSEQPWSATSGQLTFGDLRHQHNVKKLRVCFQDNGRGILTMTVTGIQYPDPNATLDPSGQPVSTNNNQQSMSQTLYVGNGSGQTITRVLDFNVPGQYIIWKISGDPGQPIDLVEVAPVFDVGGEQRGG